MKVLQRTLNPGGRQRWPVGRSTLLRSQSRPASVARAARPTAGALPVEHNFAGKARTVAAGVCSRWEPAARCYILSAVTPPLRCGGKKPSIAE